MPRPRASMGKFLRDVMKLNLDSRNFRIFGPDETTSNRLGRGVRGDEPDARSRRFCRRRSRRARRPRDGDAERAQCQGWLEGYLLTGRHGFFSCYEAFIHIVDSMFNQHAKWLKVTRRHSLAPADRVAELSAHLARLAAGSQRLQPQDPGFIDHVVNKKAEVIRVYLPPDANTLLSRDRPLPAQPQLRQCHRRRQAAGAAVARHGRGDQALHRRHRHLAMGEQRSRRRARRRDGVRRRRADAGNAGGGRICCASTFPI